MIRLRWRDRISQKRTVFSESRLNAIHREFLPFPILIRMRAKQPGALVQWLACELKKRYCRRRRCDECEGRNFSGHLLQSHAREKLTYTHWLLPTREQKSSVFLPFLETVCEVILTDEKHRPRVFKFGKCQVTWLFGFFSRIYWKVKYTPRAILLTFFWELM